MQQRFFSAANNLYRKILQPSIATIRASTPPPPPPPSLPLPLPSPQTLCDIFINHRGIDTKRTISGLLHFHLFRLGLRPFLDSMNMKPGDKLFEKIDPAIRDCKLGIAVFSPNYCDSYFCLHELALLMESKKRVIPIFCDVKPSQLQVTDYGTRSAEELERFRWALEEAKYTVGLTFDTLDGDWSGFLNTATDAIIKNLVELEAENSSKKTTYIVQSRL